MATTASVFTPAIPTRLGPLSNFNTIIMNGIKQKPHAECQALFITTLKEILALDKRAETFTDLMRKTNAVLISATSTSDEKENAAIGFEAARNGADILNNQAIKLIDDLEKNCQNALSEDQKKLLRDIRGTLEEIKGRLNGPNRIADDDVTRARQTQQWGTIRERAGIILRFVERGALGLGALAVGGISELVRNALQRFITQP